MQRALQGVHQHLQIVRDQDPEAGAAERAGKSNEDTLNGEGSKDVARAGTQGTQQSDIGLLLLHDHHQGRDNIEGRDRDQHQQNNEQHGFGDLNRAEKIGMIVRPVTHVETPAQRERERAHRARRALRVRERETNAAHPVAEAIKTCRIGEMHQRKAAIIFVHARFK